MFNSDANRLKQTFIWTFLILCIWEFASRTGLVNTDILPPCTSVVRFLDQFCDSSICYAGVCVFKTL